MKFTFLALVIYVLCCASVRGELKMYPDIPQEENFDSVQNPQYPIGFDPRWKWNYRDQEYFNPKFNWKLKEFLAHRRKQHPFDTVRENVKILDDLPDDLDYRSQQILGDVRPYPQEENDFSFYNNAEREREQEVKVVDDPTDFAYVPPDPRFYEGLPDSVLRIREDPQVVSDEVDDDEDDDDEGKKILVNVRNGESFASPQEYIQPESDNAVEVVAVRPHPQEIESAGVYIIAIVAGISAAATVGLIAFAIGWYNLQKHVKSSSDAEYPTYGITGPNKEVSPSGDRRLAQSAQMYHYQHQKQQIIAMENAPASNDRHGSISEADSDEENEEGDYTVYECPGLAPTGEMEVKNPLFQDDPTPAQTPQVKQNDGNVQKK